MLSPIKRRLLTRAIAIVPAVAVLLHAGEDGFLQLLVLSQVVLSLQLPFAILPLICFTSAKSIMGSFASPTWLQCMAYSAAFLIIALNAWLVVYKHWGRSARSQAQEAAESYGASLPCSVGVAGLDRIFASVAYKLIHRFTPEDRKCDI